MHLGHMAALAAFAALSGCTTTHGMGHGAMSNEEMMRHCQAMQEHHDGSGTHPSHDPAQHGGMSHEEMMRHCAEMRAGQTPQQQ